MTVASFSIVATISTKKAFAVADSWALVVIPKKADTNTLLVPQISCMGIDAVHVNVPFSVQGMADVVPTIGNLPTTVVGLVRDVLCQETIWPFGRLDKVSAPLPNVRHVLPALAVFITTTDVGIISRGLRGLASDFWETDKKTRPPKVSLCRINANETPEKEDAVAIKRNLGLLPVGHCTPKGQAFGTFIPLPMYVDGTPFPVVVHDWVGLVETEEDSVLLLRHVNDLSWEKLSEV